MTGRNQAIDNLNGRLVLDIHPRASRPDDERQKARAAALTKYRRRWDLLPNALALIQELTGCLEVDAFELWKTSIADGRVHARGPEQMVFAGDKIRFAAISQGGGGVFLLDRLESVPWVETDMEELRDVFSAQTTPAGGSRPKATPAIAAARKAKEELWPDGIPPELSAKKRNAEIIKWCKKRGYNTSEQSIRRALSAQSRA